jgi:hypothetical protein
VLYTALEPYARRRWPHMLISWKRLLGGGVRDPLVGRDVLTGAAAGVAMSVIYLAGLLVPAALGRPASVVIPFVQGPTLTLTTQVLFRIFVNQYSAVLFAMVFLFVLVLLRMVLRRDWLAAVAFAVFAAGPIPGEDPVYGWASGAFRAVIIALVLTRGGLLALAAALVYMFTVVEIPLTLDLGAWYVVRAAPVLIVLAAIAVYAFHTSLAGKPMFGSLFDD